MTDPITWVQKETQNLIARPEMYGGPEAVEMQFLTMAEFMVVLTVPKVQLQDSLREIKQDWSRYLGSRGLHSNLALSSQFLDEDEAYCELKLAMSEMIEKFGLVAGPLG